MDGSPPSSGRGRARIAETVVVGAAGAALAGAVGSLFGLRSPAAVVGGLNGALAGARGIHGWDGARGPLAFVLDSTWALPMSAVALLAHAVAATQPDGGGYVRELSERADRHVYASGLRVRKGFAITIGNVVNGAGDVRRSARRVRLVTDHEDVHVWQARYFGPLYPVLYVGWSIGGAAAGAVLWATRRRDASCFAVIETCAYYLNPFEWWAYSRDDLWPPPGKVAGIGWRRPMVRPFKARPGSRRGTPAPPD